MASRMETKEWTDCKLFPKVDHLKTNFSRHTSLKRPFETSTDITYLGVISLPFLFPHP